MSWGAYNSVHDTWSHLVAREPGKCSIYSEQDSITNIGRSTSNSSFTCPVLLGISFGNTILVSLLFYWQFFETQ